MTELLKTLSITIHALQLERGCSTIFVDSEGRQFIERLEQYRLASDLSLAEVANSIDARGMGASTDLNLEPLFSSLVAALRTIRQEMDSFDSGARLVKSFSENVINPVMMMVKKISYSLPNANPSQIAAYNNFMAMKEVMGKERAHGARMFIQPHRKLDHARIVHYLLQEQHLHEMAFQELADDSLKNATREWFSGDQDIKTDISKLLLQLDNHYEKAITNDINLETWFDLMTGNIDRMLEVEMLVIDHLVGSKALDKEDANKLSAKRQNETNGIFTIIKELPLFKNVKEEVLEKIAEDASVYHLARGDQVISSGEKLQQLNVVLKGWVKTYHSNLKGDEAILQLLGKGEEVAGSAVYREVTVKYSAEMVTDGAVLRVSANVMRQAVNEDATLMTNALLTLANRSQRQLQHLEQLSLLSAEERIMVFLHNLNSENILISNEPIPIEDKEVVLPFSKTVVAGALNMSPESLSRGFARLKEKNLIGIEGNVITLNANKERI